MSESASPANSDHSATRRDFLYLTAGAMGVAAGASFVWPVINSLSPAADTLALASTEVDLSPMRLVADAFMVGRHTTVEPFEFTA